MIPWDGQNSRRNGWTLPKIVPREVKSTMNIHKKHEYLPLSADMFLSIYLFKYLFIYIEPKSPANWCNMQWTLELMSHFYCSISRMTSSPWLNHPSSPIYVTWDCDWDILGSTNSRNMKLLKKLSPSDPFLRNSSLRSQVKYLAIEIPMFCGLNIQTCYLAHTKFKLFLPKFRMPTKTKQGGWTYIYIFNSLSLYI